MSYLTDATINGADLLTLVGTVAVAFTVRAYVIGRRAR